MATRDAPFHELREGDRRPWLEHTLLDPNGDPVDLSTAYQVTFTMVRAGSKRAIVDEAVATIVAAALGQVRYRWQPGDLDEPGEYLGWWRVYWDQADDTDVETYPNGEESFIEFYITHGSG